MAKTQYKFEPEFAVAPGETLLETMESLGMTQKELAIRTGMTVQSLNRIFKGEQPITYETANHLELATGVPARFWNNLEALYREQLAKISELENLKHDLSWLKEIPVSELRKRGKISASEDKITQLREALQFYGVSSVQAWRDLWTSPSLAAKRSSCFETLPGAASAWIRLGELQAQEIQASNFDKGRFSLALRDIRRMTVQNFETVISQVIQLCADAGVALVLVQKFDKVPWDGATKWLTPTKAMILLSMRGRTEDKFWFSFFHEAAHILLHNKTTLYIADKSDDIQEQQANKYAAGVLIPERFDTMIKKLQSPAELQRIAIEIGVSAGIVAGRYQKLTGHWSWFRDLIKTIELKENMKSA